MVSVDEDALICDLAETYGIYYYRQFPARLIATLAMGLDESSRIKRKLSGTESSTIDRILLAMVVDGVNMLAWMQSKDGQRGVNRPKSIASQFIGQNEKKQYRTFATPEEYEQERQRILEKMER